MCWAREKPGPFRHTIRPDRETNPLTHRTESVRALQHRWLYLEMQTRRAGSRGQESRTKTAHLEEEREGSNKKIKSVGNTEEWSHRKISNQGIVKTKTRATESKTLSRKWRKINYVETYFSAHWGLTRRRRLNAKLQLWSGHSGDHNQRATAYIFRPNEFLYTM